MTIIQIDKDTVKEVKETIIDLRVLKTRIAEIDVEIQNNKNQPEMVKNEMKYFEIDRLGQEKQRIQDQLNSYIK